MEILLVNTFVLVVKFKSALDLEVELAGVTVTYQ